MNIDFVISIFDKVIGDLDQIVSDELTVIANDGLDIVDRRITRQGKKYDGSPLPDYSPGYKIEKKKAKRYRGFVDLTFTGNMWKNIGIVSTKKEGNTTTVTVAGKDQFTKNKMSGNADKRGDFLTLSMDEINILKEDSKERLEGKINGYFQ